MNLPLDRALALRFGRDLRLERSDGAHLILSAGWEVARFDSLDGLANLSAAEAKLIGLAEAGVLRIGLPQASNGYRRPRINCGVETRDLVDAERGEH